MTRMHHSYIPLVAYDFEEVATRKYVTLILSEEDDAADVSYLQSADVDTMVTMQKFTNDEVRAIHANSGRIPRETVGDMDRPYLLYDIVRISQTRVEWVADDEWKYNLTGPTPKIFTASRNNTDWDSVVRVYLLKRLSRDIRELNFKYHHERKRNQ